VVRSQRGTDGGFRLAREPGQITIADIAGSDLPDSINRLADDPEAWVTR
jgi:hypothetical protein